MAQQAHTALSDDLSLVLRIRIRQLQGIQPGRFWTNSGPFRQLHMLIPPLHLHIIKNKIKVNLQNVGDLSPV